MSEAPVPPAASTHTSASSLDRRGRRAAFIKDLLRAAVLITAPALLGLVANAASTRPVPIFDARGPGALPPSAPRISVEEFRKALAERPLRTILLDARHESLLKEGVPLGAFRVLPESFAEDLKTIAPYLQQGFSAVVLCDSDGCLNSDRIAEMLAERGHAGAKVFAGGWPAYREAGLPLEGVGP